MAEILQLNRTRLLLCDCLGTQAPDAEAIREGTGLACERVCSHLCGAEQGVVEEALASGERVIVACGQEAPRFAEMAEEADGLERLSCIDIRDRAGWGEAPAGPKMAALLAGERLAAPEIPLMDVASGGLCLVYGRAEVALPAAERLAGTLTVTVMLTEPEEILPPKASLDIVSGRITRLTGALGGFAIEADRFAPLEPGGRGALGFAVPRDGARSECDLVVDLSGGPALVPAPHKRDGYLRADPGDPIAVERALFDAAQLIGEFEKPLHIRFTESLCAHSRAGQTGCTRCLDVCPTSAIAPNGDHVAIDPNVCAGCGACSAVCPSGAAATEEPPVGHLFRKLRVMAEAYRAAGGGAPRLLVHDDHGAEMIRLGARFGRGLPADVIPIEVPALASFGHAEQVTALALGYAGVDILAAPRTERESVESQIALARAVADGALAAATAGQSAQAGDDIRDTPAQAGDDTPDAHEHAGEPPRIRLLDEADPDALMELLHGPAAAPHGAEPILAAGGRRESLRLGARALAGGAAPEEPLPLPEGAPYGAVVVDTGACTLCLACAGLCPTGALGDNPDRPELTFREEACIQCGLCAGLCPETAITLVPRLDLSDAALRPRVLNEEEPFACVECGKLFGVKSTIERITEKLGGAHAMFRNPEQIRMIQMCDDCRVRAQFHSESAPFRFGERPRVRTTDDYLEGGED
jgi:ferredoxin